MCAENRIYLNVITFKTNRIFFLQSKMTSKFIFDIHVDFHMLSLLSLSILVPSLSRLLLRNLTLLVTTALIVKGRRPLIRSVWKYNLFRLPSSVGGNTACCCSLDSHSRVGLDLYLALQRPRCCWRPPTSRVLETMVVRAVKVAVALWVL